MSLMEPATVKQTLSDPNWLIAMKTEYQALLSIVTLSPHKKVIV